MKPLQDTPMKTQLLAASLACLCLGASGALRAENAIAVGYGEGAAGTNGIQVMITATNDIAIHGYSLAVAYPASALTLREISLAGSYVGAQVSPDFVSPTVNNQLGVGTLGVIFSFKEPVALKELAPSAPGAYPRVIAVLTFDVRANAKGGLYSIDLRDGIGSPAGFNRFSNRGASVAPTLHSGTFLVFGGNILSVDRKIAFAGASTVSMFAYAQHPKPLDGFQVAISYNKSDLVLQGDATYTGTVLGLELPPQKIELYNYDLDLNFSPTRARAAVAVLFDFIAPYDGQQLRANTDSPASQSLIKYNFKVNATADDLQQWQDVLLDDANIPGAVDNRFIIDAESIDPRLVHGKVYFSQGNVAGKVIDSSSAQGVSGVRVTLSPEGYSATTGADGSYSISAVIPGLYSVSFSKTGYFTTRHSAAQGGGAILVAGNSATFNIGTLPIYPVLETIEVPVYSPFVRANVNLDSRVDLSDAVFLLNYLFQGGSRPRCLQAADTNDDNRSDISDSVFLLNHLFAGGLQPPPPFSRNNTGCSLDPTPGGALDCKEFPCTN